MAGEVERLSGKLGIDTTDFKAAIAAANRELRVLESGFKASAAALNDWTKDATGLESRVKTLTSQIDIQKAKVAALAAEHQRLAEENGENSRAAQDAEIKLNKETETLNKMERELGDTNEALQEVKEGEDQTGDAAEEMGEQVEQSGEKIDGMQTILAGVGGAIGIAVAALAALGTAAIGAVSAISELVLNAAEAGSAIQDMADKTGISAEKLQELQFIGNQTGVSIDTITGAQVRLIRAMASAQDGTGEQAKAFEALGISVTDANGNLRDSQTVFNEAIDALGKITNPTERDAAAMQLFGKSAQELNPLIKLGAAGMEDMAQQAHDLGAVMSDDTVAALDEFDDTLSGLQDGLKGTLNTLAASFLPVAQKLAGVFQDQVLPVIRDFVALAAEKLKPVIEFIVSLIDQFASGDTRGGLARLLGADNADAILNLANIVKDFIQNTLLPFFSTHSGDISDTFQRIIGGVIAIATVITNLAIAWTKTWFTMHDILAPIWEGFLLPIFSKLLSWFSGELPTAIQGLSSFWETVLLPAIQNVWGFVQENLLPLLQLVAQFIADTFVQAVQDLTTTWQTVLLPALQVVWTFLQENVFPLIQAISEFISAVFNLALRAMAGVWQNLILPALQAIYGFLQDNIMPIFRTVGGYISDTFQPILDDLASFLRDSLEPAFNGIVSAIQKAVDWIHDMADAINNLELPDWLTPGSPTPWEIGLIGINKAMQDLNKQLPTMANGLNRVAYAGLPAGNTAGTQTAAGSVQNDQYQFFAPVVFQGDTPADSLGANIRRNQRY